MRSRWREIVLTAAALVSLFGGSTFGQSVGEESKRKVKTRVSPVYPELAKRMNVTGKVKIEVVITSEGRVKSTRAVGGHPLLVQACLDAVKEWRFVAAPEESTQVVEFDFTGNS